MRKYDSHRHVAYKCIIVEYGQHFSQLWTQDYLFIKTEFLYIFYLKFLMKWLSFINKISVNIDL